MGPRAACPRSFVAAGPATSGAVGAAAAVAGPAWQPSLAASLCGEAALLTSIHLPRILWLSYCSNAAATAAAPSWPGRKHTKPKPRERPVPSSFMTLALTTLPWGAKYSWRSSSVQSSGKWKTKRLQPGGPNSLLSAPPFFASSCLPPRRLPPRLAPPRLPPPSRSRPPSRPSPRAGRSPASPPPPLRGSSFSVSRAPPSRRPPPPPSLPFSVPPASGGGGLGGSSSGGLSHWLRPVLEL
mmetsp:Transcript_4050/g.12633  ORF Transcript_4050/g.12633 Transcript_4050/m.12633 type:complete len:240 (-) Transcript_4050:1176-1895(-)